MTKKQKETLAVIARQILRTKRMILKLAPALILFALPALAQAPETHTFTLNPVSVLAVPYNNGQHGQSYYTYYGTSFDGVAYTQSASFTEVDHLQSYLTPTIPELFDFNFPVGASYKGCTETEVTLEVPTATGKTTTTTASFTCQGAAIQTTEIIDWFKVSCGGRGGGYLRKCYIVAKQYPIQGSVTEGQ